MGDPEAEPASTTAAGGGVRASGQQVLEAVRLGEQLDDNHRADPGELQSIGTCRRCGYLIFESTAKGWRHLPSAEEREQASRWLAAHPSTP